MVPRAYQRARRLFEWAPCAPHFVRERLDALLCASALPVSLREDLERLRPAPGPAPGLWACRFPVVASAGHEDGLDGGLLTLVSTGAEVRPPTGGRAAADCLELGPIPPTAGVLSVTGLPSRADVLLVGRSGSAAAWLAVQARLTHRAIPSDVVVSADLIPGPDGVPRLAPVSDGGLKARIVAREAPGARLLLCGDPEGEPAEVISANVSVRELERAVWGSVAVADPERLAAVIKAAGDAFKRHDYATARASYRVVAGAEGGGDPEQLFEAYLRLAAIEVHSGRAAAAGHWYTRADAVQVPRAWKAGYLVERAAGLAGQAIDAFRPEAARALLGSPEACRAAEPAHPNDWERMQVLGAWRRLHLLDGFTAAAREVQRALLELTDAGERHRALLDLGFVELRHGDLEAAATTLLAARQEIEGLPTVYGVQSSAFLAWHVGRLVARGGLATGLGDLLDAAALDRLVDHPRLQDAGRWRVRAVRAALAGDEVALLSLARGLSTFQQWYFGVFLLESPGTRDVGLRILADTDVDLSGMPELQHAREGIRAGRADPGVFIARAPY